MTIHKIASRAAIIFFLLTSVVQADFSIFQHDQALRENVLTALVFCFAFLILAMVGFAIATQRRQKRSLKDKLNELQLNSRMISKMLSARAQDAKVVLKHLASENIEDLVADICVVPGSIGAAIEDLDKLRAPYSEPKSTRELETSIDFLQSRVNLLGKLEKKLECVFERERKFRVAKENLPKLIPEIFDLVDITKKLISYPDVTTETKLLFFDGEERYRKGIEIYEKDKKKIIAAYTELHKARAIFGDCARMVERDCARAIRARKDGPALLQSIPQKISVLGARIAESDVSVSTKRIYRKASKAFKKTTKKTVAVEDINWIIMHPRLLRINALLDTVSAGILRDQRNAKSARRNKASSLVAAVFGGGVLGKW